MTKPSYHNINGYNVILLPMAGRTLYVYGCVNSGSIHETMANLGISHLLEHVLTDSWEKCGKKPCAEYWLTKGINTNATTDHTVVDYWIQGLSEYSMDMVKYIIDITSRPYIRNAVLEKERTAVKAELLNYFNEADQNLLHQFNRKVFGTKGVAEMNNWPTQLKNLKKFKKRDLFAFCDRLYTPQNTMLCIAGNFKKESMKKFLASYLPKKSNTKINAKDTAFFTLDRGVYYFAKRDAKNTNIIVGFTSPEIKPSHPYYIYLPVVRGMLVNSFSSILLKHLRTKHKLVYHISLSIDATHYGVLTTLKTSCSHNNVEKTITETIKKIKEIRGRFDPKILTNAKNEFRLAYHNKCDTDATLGSFYTKQYFLQMYDRKKHIFTRKQQFDAITSLSYKRMLNIFKVLFNFDNCIVTYEGKRKGDTRWENDLL